MKRLLHVFDLRDGLFLLGVGLLVYGLAQIYIPAAYIVPGVLLMGLAFWRVR